LIFSLLFIWYIWIISRNKTEFCVPEPYIFSEGPWSNQGYLSVECTLLSCTKICESNSACLGTVLNATNISNMSGTINMIPGNQNNIIVLINCSTVQLSCEYESTSAAANFVVNPNSVFVVESTAPTSTASYTCTEI